jgi:PTS system cellobiose-specific IIB component
MPNIMVICGFGLSTSFIVTKMKAAFRVKGLTGEIIARPAADMFDYINDIDIIMVAPHVTYLLKDVEDLCKKYNKKCVVIPGDLYGKMDGEKIVDLALGEIQ